MTMFINKASKIEAIRLEGLEPEDIRKVTDFLGIQFKDERSFIQYCRTCVQPAKGLSVLNTKIEVKGMYLAKNLYTNEIHLATPEFLAFNFDAIPDVTSAQQARIDILLNNNGDYRDKLYRHFKVKEGKHNWYYAEDLATSATNNSDGIVVIYTPLYPSDISLFTRDIREFTSLVEEDKYPEYKDSWRMTSYREIVEQLGKEKLAWQLLLTEVNRDFLSDKNII